MPPAKRKPTVVKPVATTVQAEQPTVEPNDLKIIFLESGFTVCGRVWKAGQVLEIENSPEGRREHEDLNGEVWYDLSADEQTDRYKKVFFSKE